MALETTSQPDLSAPLEEPKIPTPLGELRPPRWKGWTLTSCSLDGISEIQSCVRHRDATPAVIIGMLVSYTSGHRECVGQFLPDWAVEPISLLGKHTLFVQHTTISRHNAAITAVTPHAPGETDGIGWTALPIAGVLDWWFARGGCPTLFRDGKKIEVPKEIDTEPAILAARLARWRAAWHEAAEE